MPDPFNCHSRYPIKPRPHILCVDDDAEILESIAGALRRHFKVTIAQSAHAAIRMINSTESFDVVVSGLHFAAMDGIRFLSGISDNAPDTSVILLTGNGNLPAGIDAFNAGHVFLLCDEKCSSAQLIEAITAGIERYDARRTERLLRLGLLSNF